MTQCAAKSKQSGEQCKNKAVDGRKVCRIHGGLSPGAPIKHGRYSKYAPEKLRDKIEAFKEDDPLSLIDELATQRALFADYLERFQANSGSLPADDIFRLMSWANDIGSMVDRMVKIRNSTAITAAEVAYLVARIPEVVTKYIDDPSKQRAFITELFGGLRSESLPATIELLPRNEG